MSYLRAEEILPKELIETIQQYVNGKIIYIPTAGKMDWGSNTDTKRVLLERNKEIFKEYQNGENIGKLAIKYSLSDKSIQRIIRMVRTLETGSEN